MSKPLFKFSSAAGALAIMTHNSMFVTSPLDLNDPFEMRPAWTNAHEQRLHENERRRSQITAGMPVFVALEGGGIGNGGTMPYMEPHAPMDVETTRGLADMHNAPVFRAMHRNFRIMSLVADLFHLDKKGGESAEKATLMWSHYGDQFKGICLALDPDHFDNGVLKDGFTVSYAPERLSLPPKYYDTYLSMPPPLASTAAFVEDAASGLLLTPVQKREVDLKRFTDLMTRKSPAWAYEHEVRTIYELPALMRTRFYKRIDFACKACREAGRPAAACSNKTYRDAVEMPPEAVRAVILGTDCSHEDTRRVLKLLAEPRYGHVELYWCSLHSSRYNVQYNLSTDNYADFIQKQRAEDIAQAKGDEADNVP